MPRLRKGPVLITVSVLVAMVLAAGLAAATYLGGMADAFASRSGTIVEAFPKESTRPVKQPAALDAVNILLMGSDTTAEDSGTADLSAEPANARTDALMLLHIPADRSGVYLMSIMRDVWTEIPGHGEHKINAAYALGGVPLTVQTVEGLFDTRVDHVAIIEFEGFRALTNTLDGVEINVDQPFDSSHMPGRHFAAGPTTMNGEEALAFVRERYAYSDGDYQRVRNQQAFIRAVLSKFLTAETLVNPVKVSHIVNEIAQYLTVDETLDPATIGSLALSLRNVRGDDIHAFTLPTKGTGWSSDGQSIVLKDEQAISEISRALNNGAMPGYWNTLEPSAG